jgi:NAD(P)-dependent dehydrogenase (short-subunit alcohol dehydrogenase family)
MELQDKTIVITGGARVGQVVAKRLAAAGAHLAMTYVSSGAEINQAIAGLKDEHSISARGYQVDVTHEEQVRGLLPAVTADFGGADGLILMASLFTEEGTVDFTSFQKTFAVNAFGNMLLARQFAEGAQARGAVSAPIVAFIDWAVDHPYAGYDTYIAAKAALRHYLMALQVSFAGHIRVVNIHPGMILEPKDFPADVKANIIANTPTQAIGTPEQAAALVQTALETDYLADNIYLAGGQQWRHRLQD